ncbi:peptide deformylase [Candidatus Microgenomates bacterium]|nr:peptide deformylase [Candidatus Microgenomates bacterium]
MKIKLVKTKNPNNIPKILREKSKPVEKITPEILDLAEKMTEIMNRTDGVGISAVQVGQLLRMMIVKVPTQKTESDSLSMDMVFINPEIIKLSGKKVAFNEGCLSFPDIFVEIIRPDICKIRFTDISGNLCEMESAGIVGRAFQHEIDHMGGILYFDHIKDGVKGLKKQKISN